MILIGPGSGIAPLRGFWQERQCQNIRSRSRNEPAPQAAPESVAALEQEVQEPALGVAKLRGLWEQRQNQANDQFSFGNRSKQQKAKATMKKWRSEHHIPTLKNELQYISYDMSPVVVQDKELNVFRKKEINSGKMDLYFGCRTSQLDWIYEREMKEARDSGVLDQLFVAFSREPGKSKVSS